MRKALRVYVLATQLIVTLIFAAVAGLLYGRFKEPEGNLSVILAGVGLMIGLFVDILIILQFLRNEAKYEHMKAQEEQVESEETNETNS